MCQRAGAKAMLGGTIASLGIELRGHAQRAGLRQRRDAGRRAGAGGEQGRRARGARRAPPRRSARQLGESLASVQRYDTEDRGGDDHVARGAQGLQPGHDDAAHAGRFRFACRSSAAPSSSIRTSRSRTRGSARCLSNLGQSDEGRKMTATAPTSCATRSASASALHRGALLHDGRARHSEGDRCLSPVARYLSERLHGAGQLRAAAQAARRNRSRAAQPGSGDARRARPAAGLGQPRQHLHGPRPPRRRGQHALRPR